MVIQTPASIFLPLLWLLYDTTIWHLSPCTACVTQGVLTPAPKHDWPPFPIPYLMRSHTATVSFPSICNSMMLFHARDQDSWNRAATVLKQTKLWGPIILAMVWIILCECTLKHMRFVTYSFH